MANKTLSQYVDLSALPGQPIEEMANKQQGALASGVVPPVIAQPVVPEADEEIPALVNYCAYYGFANAAGEGIRFVY